LNAQTSSEMRPALDALDVRRLTAPGRTCLAL
jgi:hypothetical protein